MQINFNVMCLYWKLQSFGTISIGRQSLKIILLKYHEKEHNFKSSAYLCLSCDILEIIMFKVSSYILYLFIYFGRLYFKMNKIIVFNIFSVLNRMG